jgi:hypothetical protein
VRCNKCKLRVMAGGIEHLKKQAEWSKTLGSPLTAAVIATLTDCLDESSGVGRRTIGWPGDADDDAISMRIAGGIHALARRGTDGELTALYKGLGGTVGDIIPRIIRDYDTMLEPWLDRPPQTNEVGRAGLLWPGLMEISRRFGPDMELIELGASAGLNMNLDRFGYDLGGLKAGDVASPVQIKPDWSGPQPAYAPVNVTSRIGVDREPVDLRDPAEVERLTAFVWADMTERMARIEGAIAIAAEHPLRIEKADLVEWLEAQLARPQASGVTRVIYHSIVFQYIPQAARDRVEELLAEAGASASTDHPLARLQMEMFEYGAPIELRLQCWPGGGVHELLATSHPHGAKIRWIGESG